MSEFHFERKEDYSGAVTVVIGDEILKGLTKDKNSVFLCRELRKMGYAVKKASRVKTMGDSMSETRNMCLCIFRFAASFA